ncbi:DUF547 domain-containing protein [Wenyingzhuangia sp. IMCC45533]
MKKTILILLTFFSLHSFSQTENWNKLLMHYVDIDGSVDYFSFSKEEKELNNYLSYLNNTSPKKTWTANKTKAFWINAYNAYTIKLILKYYPVKSILDIQEEGKTAWEIPFAKVGGNIYTLNQIEHEILRKQYNDPRIHSAVNCASMSCPALINRAYTEDNIEELLNKGMKSFVNDPVRNMLSTDEVYLSQIFNWFKGDFTQQTDLITFINQYSKIHINPNAVVKYKEYDWNLNKH